MPLTHDEKMELVKELPGENELAFSAPPVATRGRVGVAWEEHLPLEQFRAHKGLGAVILTAYEDDKANGAVRNAIVGRLAKVHPTESWTTYVSDGDIYLKFNGAKVARVAKAAE